MPDEQGVFAPGRAMRSAVLALWYFQESTKNQKEQGGNRQSEISWQCAVRSVQKRKRKWAIGSSQFAWRKYS
jgi:hypothetical protein